MRGGAEGGVRAGEDQPEEGQAAAGEEVVRTRPQCKLYAGCPTSLPGCRCLQLVPRSYSTRILKFGRGVWERNLGENNRHTYKIHFYRAGTQTHNRADSAH